MKTLGLDLGTNSLGWAIIETQGEPGANDEGHIVASGVRIFSQSEMAGRDPQSKASLAVARREARGMRRRRDRYLKRRQRLLALLTAHGLMPDDDKARQALVRDHDDGKGGDLSNSVYALRARALDKALTPHEIGRAIFLLNQRRGFKSNRKADSNDPEQGKIATAIHALDEKMMEARARTYGEWLHMRRSQGLSVRARMTADGEGYDFYGYTVLRATISRAICAAGLHPSIGLHHANRGNAFALADDLMEPYRPIVDRAVYNLVRDGCMDVSPEAKTALAALTALDLVAPHGMSPLYVHATRLAQQLAALFAKEGESLDLPLPPDPLTLSSLARRERSV
jgi:hypothetical protein